MSDLDIEGNLRRYMGDRIPTARYASFDYCFNHFQSHRDKARLGALIEEPGLQLSCLHLGFYLASWGMLRGSSDLLQRSVKVFAPTVVAIATAPPDMWDIDADSYSENRITAILDFASTLRGTLYEGASPILLTKIMLGTMGCVPAFDTNFKKGFGVSTFGRKSLHEVGRFYRDNVDIIDSHREPTFDFDTGLTTERRYTRAKVIDMIFFIEGMS